jgi:hypothetical protein
MAALDGGRRVLGITTRAVWRRMALLSVVHFAQDFGVAIHTPLLNRGAPAVCSPADRLLAAAKLPAEIDCRPLQR